MKLLLSERIKQEDFRKALQELRSAGIGVTGPYRRRNGVFVFTVGGFVMTEDELLGLLHAGKLNAPDVSEFTAKMRNKNEIR